MTLLKGSKQTSNKIWWPILSHWRIWKRSLVAVIW